jgi:cytochrome c551
VNSVFNIPALLAKRQHLILISLFITACSLWLAACDRSTNHSTKFQQYYAQGEQLYIKNCSNCHQKKGGGLGLLYPPLNPSDYMDEHVAEVICLMKYGKEGEITVNGKKFNKPMKGNYSLTELEVAEIATYIYNTWGHEQGLIEIKQVNEALKKCQK